MVCLVPSPGQLACRILIEGKCDRPMAETMSYVAQNGGVVVNISEIQTLEIEGTFAYQNSELGWMISMQTAGKVTLNFRANMRRLDFPLLDGDQLVRNADDLLIIRTHSAEDYRAARPGSGFTSTQRSGSPLARSSTRQMGSLLASDVDQIVETTESGDSG